MSYDHSNECGLCDRDNVEELYYLDNRPMDNEEWGFCINCYERILETGRLE